MRLSTLLTHGLKEQLKADKTPLYGAFCNEASIEVEYIIDMEKVTAYGVMNMPALVVNEKAAAMGHGVEVCRCCETAEENR